MKNNFTQLLHLSMREIIAIVFNKIILAHMLDWLNDKFFLQCSYYVHMGKKLNLNNPVTLTEKIQWIKLYDRRPLYTQLSDKAQVKKWVNETLGQDICIPTLGIWDSFDQIDFSTLPERFILKCTHDSGSFTKIENKQNMDYNSLEKRFKHYLGKNMFFWGREFVYKEIKPRIIAEPYMEDVETGELRDYKFFCFNGEPKIMFVASERQNRLTETRFDFFDINYNHLELLNGHPNAENIPSKPHSYEQMIKDATKLSHNIPFVRVDFYEINGKRYFGEMTFYHNCGWVPFEPNTWDIKMGNWLHLPQIN